MHRLKFGIAVAGLALTGGVVWSQTHESATCPTTVVLGGISYSPADMSEEVISGDELGIGVEQGCGGRGPYTREVTMNSIAGVDRGLAITSPVSAHTVYLAPGVTTEDLHKGFGP